jgi:hypothetical protein
MRAFTLDRFDVPPGLREDFPAPAPAENGTGEESSSPAPDLLVFDAGSEVACTGDTCMVEDG